MAKSGIFQVAGSVDTHAHVFRHDLPMKPDRRHSPDFDALPQDYLAHLDNAGVQFGVLVQPSFLGTDNSYMLQTLASHPERLRGVAVVDAACTEDELDRLALAGVVGIRLNLVGLPLPDLGNTQWRSLLSRVAARGWHVEVHRAAADLPLLIPHILKTGGHVVVDHFGRPDPVAGEEDPGFRYLLSQASEGRVWVKLSASYRTWKPEDGNAGLRSTALARLLLQSFGPRRLLWGSDWPHTENRQVAGYARSRQWLDEWVPEAEDRERILVSSPAELFGFQALPERSSG
ncbi:amidohydrolase family protein [Paracandidimonas soli]|uniref:amidohydrolase family protein n=1 Tax=Paracandidimonas soli TaxID=1917182 RepID=UPI003341EC0F